MIQYGLGHGTNLFVNNLAAFEHQQGRDAAHTETGCYRGIFVDIQFADNRLTFVIAGKLFYYRSDHLTGTTPFGPEVYQYRLIRIYDLIEVSICKFNCFSHESYVL